MSAVHACRASKSCAGANIEKSGVDFFGKNSRFKLCCQGTVPTASFDGESNERSKDLGESRLWDFSA